jgi:SRSO17 transposase
VGVARQYSGTLGKVGNCQVTLNCHYAERTMAWPVATRLYLPQPWADDPARRQKAQVPEDIDFQTKPAIALDLLDQADAWGVPYACVVADADYGDNPNFLAGLEQRHKRYVDRSRSRGAWSASRRGSSGRPQGSPNGPQAPRRNGRATPLPFPMSTVARCGRAEREGRLS